MTQIISAIPHDQTENCLLCQPVNYFPSAQTAEHAALVEAIRQNFPEIYQLPAASLDCTHSDKAHAWNQEMQPSAAA
jgi:hypothetical protein